jgi:hypothetical protein
MKQDKTAKDEIAQGMADAGKTGGKPATDQGNQPGQLEDIAKAGAKALPKMAPSEPATAPRG